MGVAEIFANQPVTTVTSGGTTAPAPGTVETWTVASSAAFPGAVSGVTQFHVTDTASGKISEIIAVTNVSGTTWTVTRGAESTTPVAHAAGFAVQQVVTAGWLSIVAMLTGATMQGWFAPAVVPLVDGATITVDASKGNDFRVTLGGNRLLTIINPADGQTITVTPKQDGTGSRLLTYDTMISFSTSLPQPGLSTTPGSSDELQFKYYASPGKWRFSGFVPGFASGS